MNASKRATGLHDLICRMLRGNHLEKMSKSQLEYYTYQAGVALHNIPLVIADGSDLTNDQFEWVNRLDPSAKPGQWGDWCKLLADSFDQTLPHEPKIPIVNFLETKAAHGAVKKMTNLDFLVLIMLCVVLAVIQQIDGVEEWFMSKVSDDFFWAGIYKAFPVLVFIFYFIGAATDAGLRANKMRRNKKNQI